MRFSIVAITTALASALASSLLLTACGGAGNQAQIASSAGNNPQVFNALSVFDPVPISAADSPSIPFPFDGLFAGFNDPTLNIPNPSNASFVRDANLIDGFSTTASGFLDMTGFVDIATVTPNLIIVNSATGAVLKAGSDYVLQGSPATAANSGGVQQPINQQRTRVLIEPLQPLAPSTRYLVGFKTGAKTKDGAGVIASAAFRILRSATPVAEQTEPILGSYSSTQKARLEQLRSQLIRPVVAAFGQLANIPETDLVLAWSFTTGSTDRTLALLASGPTGVVGPSPAGGTIAVGSAGASARLIRVQNTGITTETAVGVAGGDIYAGIVQVPYFLANSGGDTHSTAALATFWAADTARTDFAAKFLGQVPCGAFATRATLPDGQTAVPSASTTLCFPVPSAKSIETLPVLVTAPTGGTKPANGWPVVIFQHGITGNRAQMLALAPALSQAGFVVVAIDLPLHGLASGPFYKNQLFAGSPAAGLMTGERTFDLDLVNNSTGAPGPDGSADPSGTHFINLSSLISSRDNLRQAVSDLLNLSKSVAALDLNNDGTPDIDASQIRFVGHSLGAIVGGTFLGVDTSVGAATLAMTGGGIAKLLDASKAFGPRIAAGLASNGVKEGSDNYETFLRFAQNLVDAADPINFTVGAKQHPLHLIEVQNDLVVPNAALASAATATQDLVTITGFLSGTEPLIALLGLNVIGPLTPPIRPATQMTGANGAKLTVATVFSKGDHGSILSPAADRDTTIEMQRETVNFLKSNGSCLPTGGNCQ